MVTQNKDFVFGTRAVIEAIKNDKNISRVLIKKGLSNELFRELMQLLKKHAINYQFVPLEKIDRVTRKNHQGVLAFVSPIQFFDIEDLLPGLYENGDEPFLLILDQITDVRNFGAIVRSAECAGVHAIIIPEKGMARIGADAVKTSAGALHKVPVCKSKNLVYTIDFLQSSGINIVAATEKAEQYYTEAKLNIPVAIVMGSEEKGVSNHILEKSNQKLKIPILGDIESLNVSVATALMIYEVVRQRTTITNAPE